MQNNKQNCKNIKLLRKMLEQKMLVTKTNTTTIQAEYQKDRVIVKKNNLAIEYTFKEVEAISGAMEAEYISNNLPTQIIENISTAPELDDLPKNPNLRTL